FSSNPPTRFLKFLAGEPWRLEVPGPRRARSARRLLRIRTWAADGFPRQRVAALGHGSDRRGRAPAGLLLFVQSGYPAADHLTSAGPECAGPLTARPSGDWLDTPRARAIGSRRSGTPLGLRFDQQAAAAADGLAVATPAPPPVRCGADHPHPAGR